MDKEKKPETRVVVEEILTPVDEPVEKKDTKPETEEKQAEIKPENKSKLNFNIFWIIFPGIILLGLLMGGIIAYYSGLNKIKSSESTTIIKTTSQPTTEIEASPSASPVSKIDLSKYKIKILNGSGIKGEAGKVQTILEKAGFTVSTTGNASKYDYAKTEIQTKEDVEAFFITGLKTALSKSYIIEDKVQTLPASSSDSVIVTVGKNSK
ncbi:MAG: LytR C-terminal domain-containing protein [bacterium]|nr:LytR C-terminal domain-containing protein [bacterium]